MFVIYGYKKCEQYITTRSDYNTEGEMYFIRFWHCEMVMLDRAPRKHTWGVHPAVAGALAAAPLLP